MLLMLANQATASKRRVYFNCKDATDFNTPETGEASGQPQVSVDGAAWTDTGIGVLVDIGSGRYYAELTQALIATAGVAVSTRYKSANTSETEGTTVQVIGINLETATQPVNVTQIDSQATNGNNATLNLKQINVVNNAGDAVIASSTGGNGNGINASGNGTGNGTKSSGGTTGAGLLTQGGSNGGAGIKALALATTGSLAAGLECQGSYGGSGIKASSGAYDAIAMELVGGNGAGYGMKATGGSGIYAGGNTANGGIHANGISGNSPGMKCSGNGSGAGIETSSASSGNGILSTGAGSSAGIRAKGGVNGSGMECKGGDTTGNGFDATGAGGSSTPSAQCGILSQAGFTGDGLRATGGIGGSGGKGIVAASGAGNQPGVQITGLGNAAGIQVTGGPTGPGIKANGGSSAGTQAGIDTTGGPSGPGLKATGGSSAGAGISAVASAGNADGIVATGNGSGAGLQTTGGTNGPGASCSAGINSGANGLVLGGDGVGSGLAATGGALGHGANIKGGATQGQGLVCSAQGIGAGILSYGGATSGDGIKAYARANNDSGLKVTGQGSGAGTTATGGATGVAAKLVTNAGGIGSLEGSVSGDVGGKVLGGGVSTITAVGAWAADGDGNAIEPANDSKLIHLDANVSSRLATVDYVEPDNGNILNIKTKTDSLPTSPAATGDIPLASEVAEAVVENSTMATALGRLDVGVSTRLATADYSAQDNSAVLDAIAALPTPATVVDLGEAVAYVEAAITASETNIRGAHADTLDSLSAQLDGMGALTGPRTISFIIRDGANAPISDVTLTVLDSTGVNVLWIGQSSAGGVVGPLAISNGTYRVKKVKAGVVFTEPESIVVTVDHQFELFGTTWTPSVPNAPNMCVIFDWIKDAAGRAVVGVPIEIVAAVPTVAGSHQLGDPIVTTLTGANGYVEFQLLQGAQVRVNAPHLGFSNVVKVVPAVPTQQLSSWA
jgi:hypothetical protein